MTLLRTLGYVPVSLDAVETTTSSGPCFQTERSWSHSTATATTSETRSRSCASTGSRPSSSRRSRTSTTRGPFPEEALLGLGVENPTLDWDELAELEAGGVRIESTRHRTQAARRARACRSASGDRHLQAAPRGASRAKVDAYAYVKGSRADFRAEHASLVQQAGYKLAFTAVSGANGPGSDRFQLLRYNIEPYSSRTFELVLAGACDALSVKDTVVGTHVDVR